MNHSDYRFQQTPFWTREGAGQEYEESRSYSASMWNHEKGARRAEDTQPPESVWTLTSTAYLLISGISLMGIGALWDPYINHLSEFYSKYNNYVNEDFQELALSLMVPLAWPIIYIVLKRARIPYLPCIATIYDVLTIISTIYFATYCCCAMTDREIYERNQVMGVVCAFVVALIHLIVIIVRVVFFMISLKYEGQFTPVGRFLYACGYSFHMAVYLITVCTSIIGFSMMIWTFDHFAYVGRNQGITGLYRASTWAGFPVLTLLLILPSIWFLANVGSMLQRGRAMSRACSHGYNTTMGVSMVGTSIFCFVKLGNVDDYGCGYYGGENLSTCPQVWDFIKPRHIVAIILALITGLIYIALAINHVRPRFESENSIDKINSLIYQLTDHERAAPRLSSNKGVWTEAELMSLLEIKTLDARTRRYIRFAMAQIPSSGYDDSPAEVLEKGSMRQMFGS